MITLSYWAWAPCGSCCGDLYTHDELYVFFNVIYWFIYKSPISDNLSSKAVLFKRRILTQKVKIRQIIHPKWTLSCFQIKKDCLIKRKATLNGSVVSSEIELIKLKSKMVYNKLSQKLWITQHNIIWCKSLNRTESIINYKIPYFYC